MGTVASITLYGPDRTRVADAVRVAVEEFRKVEATCNVFDSESELSRLNRNPPGKAFACSPGLWDVLLESRKYDVLSGGLFDVTAKPLMELWGFHRKRETVPSEEEIRQASERVGLSYVSFDEDSRSVVFERAGILIDLGGIAKGYAVDRAAESVLELGIRSGVLNLGGNVRCLSDPPPGKTAYEIGIRNPVDKDSVCGSVRILDRSVATSGNYERYVVLDGKRYTHIMNPKTGCPVTDMLGVTVVTPKAVCADALSTAVFIGGRELAERLCREIPGTQILIIRNEEGNPDSLLVEKVGEIWGDVQVSVPVSRDASGIPPDGDRSDR
jgi:thiamine biosynthesis lipoprotein